MLLLAIWSIGGFLPIGKIATVRSPFTRGIGQTILYRDWQKRSIQDLVSALWFSFLRNICQDPIDLPPKVFMHEKRYISYRSSCLSAPADCSHCLPLGPAQVKYDQNVKLSKEIWLCIDSELADFYQKCANLAQCLQIFLKGLQKFGSVGMWIWLCGPVDRDQCRQVGNAELA